MIRFVQVAKLLLMLLLAIFVLSSLVGIVNPDTGSLEKLVLLALIGGCIVIAAKISTLATMAHERLQNR